MTPADAPREAVSVFDDVDANKLGTAVARRIYASAPARLPVSLLGTMNLL